MKSVASNVPASRRVQLAGALNTNGAEISRWLDLQLGRGEGSRTKVRSFSEAQSIRFQHTPKLSGPPEHLHYDTFRTRWADRTIEDAYVTFALKPDGAIDRMTMRTVSPLADFSFDYSRSTVRAENPAARNAC